MKKTLVASAIAMAMGSSAASALTVSITEMNFNGLYNATGTVNSNASGTFTSLDKFFNAHWTADAVAYFDTTGAHTWAGAGGGNTNDGTANGNYSYNFSLTSNQRAWGTFFDWGGTYDIPVLNIMTCTGFSTGDTCAGTGTPMQTLPFPGQAPAFNGVVASSSASQVPVPAAAWLMGSGLVGLAGISRRRKKA